MLVLSRKKGESFIVPECNLTVTVLSVQGGRIRIGIEAPAEVGVHRTEIVRTIGQAEARGLNPVD